MSSVIRSLHVSWALSVTFLWAVFAFALAGNAEHWTIRNGFADESVFSGPTQIDSICPPYRAVMGHTTEKDT
jgi:hypothetical protein